jgi:PAS domain S-box-containing protein
LPSAQPGDPVAVVLVTGQGDEETAVAASKLARTITSSSKRLFKDSSSILENALQRYRKTKTRFSRPIRVLYAEHNAIDIDLTLRHIKSHTPHIQMDIARDTYTVNHILTTATAENHYDVFLVDLHLPGEDALSLVKRILEDPLFEYPVVLITGQGNEETAVNVLKLGVVDYLVKTSGYLYRLPAVLENANNLLSLYKEKEALAQSESQFRLLAENALDIIFRLKIRPKIEFDYISPAVLAITGFSPEEIYAHPEQIFKAAREKIDSMQNFIRILKMNDLPDIVFPFLTKDKRRIILDLRGHVTKNDLNQPVLLEGITRDITDRVEIETKLQNRMHKLNALHTIDTAINSSFDLKFTYQVLLEQVISLTKARAAIILVFDPDFNNIKLAASSGFLSSTVSITNWIKKDPLPPQAAVERRIVETTKQEIEGNIFEMAELYKKEGVVKHIAVPMIMKGYVKGVLELYFTDFVDLDMETQSFLETIVQQAAIALESVQNFEQLQRTNQELLKAYDETLVGWVNFLDLRDRETEGHTVRVLDETMKICSEFNFSNEELINIRRGALLHDIGKVGVPDAILNKPGPLTDEEWLIMKKHPVLANQMLSPISYLRRHWIFPIAIMKMEWYRLSPGLERRRNSSRGTNLLH